LLEILDYNNLVKGREFVFDMYKLDKDDVPALVILAVFALVSFFIVKNFIVLLAFTAILTYLYRPAYERINAIFNSHFFTSVVSILLLFCLLIVPVVFAILEFSNEFSHIEAAQAAQSQRDFTSILSNKIGVDISSEYHKALGAIGSYSRSMIYSQLPEAVFSIVIMIFFFYYFLKNYDVGERQLKGLMGVRCFEKWTGKIKRLLDGIVYGQILTRLIQAIVATILFLLFGVGGAVVWGVLTFFAAFVPIVGTSLIWGPLVLLNVLQENYFLASLVLIAGLVISTIDNFMLPHFISEKTNIGPVTTLVSILGGLSLFGIYGLILGPFCLGIFLILFKEFVFRMRRKYPEIDRHIWSDWERARYRSLPTVKDRDDFRDKLNKQYNN